MPDGIRLGGAFYELTADDAQMIRALARAQSQAKSFGEATARAMGVASGSTDAAMKKMAASTRQAESGFSSLAKSAAGFGIAVVGIGSAAEIARKSLDSIVESTKNAQQAQFALAKTYGASAPQMVAFSKQFADQVGRSTTEVMQAAVIVGNLTKEYGLNQAQARELIRISADLAAVYGKDLPDAVQRLQSAIRGEAEAAESLGLVLNDDAVAVRQLGQEHKDLWQHLTDSEKAQLRLIEATKQLAERHGAAEERAAGLLGAFDRLTKASDELGAALGTALLPAAASVADALATMGQEAVATLAALNDLSNLDLSKLEKIAEFFTQFGLLGPVIKANAAAIAAIAAAIGVQNPLEPPPRPGDTGRGRVVRSGRIPGPTLDEADANAKQEAEKAAIIAKARAKAELEAADKANTAQLDSALKAIEAERRAKEAWYDEERTRIETRKANQLKDIEERKQATLDALAAEKQATLDAIDDQIRQQEQLKQVRLDAAEAAADAAKATLAAEKQRLDIERELEDRALADTRQAEDRSLEDARRVADRSRHQSEEDELQGLKALTDARKDAVDAGIAALERATTKRIAALDRESDRARANGEKALHRLELQGEAEDELHRTRMQALEDEQDARLAILDAQLRALDVAEKTAAAARRSADLQKRIAEAQKAQTAAQGTGTPEQIAEARAELTRAFRVGDELSIANARERLTQLAGQGTEAIKKADEELADAQQELRDQGVDGARDAEREKLKVAQDAVKAEIDARKRAEDDGDRARKLDLERAQEHEQGKLKATLERIDKQKQAVQDHSKTAQQALRDELDADQKTAAEQVRLTRDRYEQEGQALEDARREEDRLREDARAAEDRVRTDARREQDTDLARQLAAVSSTLEAERRETEAHYNGPRGVITQLKQARTDAEREYSARLAAVTRAYEAEREAAERMYHNAEGTGELDLLAKQRAAEMQALSDRRDEYQEQAKAHHEMIQQMIADLNNLAAANANASSGGVGSSGSDSRAGGSGKATSSSSANTKSGKSGKDVKGTLGTWINDAMDITGVGDDWAKGLYELVQKESGGDPHNVNPQDVIDPKTGRNLGNAKGLLQMLNPTFSSYRNKDLPNDIFDPVANAVASIRYIIATYGHVKNIPGLFSGTFRGYDAGGLIREPVAGMGLHSGRPYAIGEYGPEYIMSRRATSAMLGGGAGSASGGMGGWLDAAHPGGGGGGAMIDNSAVNFYGLTYEQATVKQRREQHRRTLLYGARRFR